MSVQVERWLELNRANWDERVPVHVASDFYDVAGFLAGRSTLRAFEVAEVGEVAAARLAHLQCHFGLDTLSWARRGAQVTGLDFSAPAIEAARSLAAQAGLGAHFVVDDVYAAVQALGRGRFDVVYTGIGALCWLPDLDRWAQVAAALLAPGGFLYLAEFHPVTDMLDDDDRPTVARDYFDRGPHVYDEPGTYADREATTHHNTTVEFVHPIGEVVTALAAAGLRIEFLHEHDVTLFARYPTLERSGGDGLYRLPPGRPRIPLMYSLRASLPG